MVDANKSLVLRFLERTYALMILAYPQAFRRRFGGEMYFAFSSEAFALSKTAGSRSLLPFFFRILLDWFVTLCKEHLAMPKRLITVAMILLLLAVDCLTFHDLFEPHTVRDYLTLAASLLVFLSIGVEVLRGDKSIRPRSG